MKRNFNKLAGVVGDFKYWKITGKSVEESLILAWFWFCHGSMASNTSALPFVHSLG